MEHVHIQPHMFWIGSGEHTLEFHWKLLLHMHLICLH